MAIYFVQSSQISGQQIELSGDLAHHLRDVLRLNPGKILNVVDERRRRYRIALNDVKPKQLKAQILSVEEPSPFISLEISLAQAVLKRPKMDWVVQKATELGIVKLLPLMTDRTVVRSTEGRAARQHDRWNRISLEAAQQCGRLEIPKIEEPTDYAHWIQSRPEADLKLFLWEDETGRTLSSSLRLGRTVRSVLVVIGAEGGFTEAEVKMAETMGFEVVTLGKRILRAETASLAALSIIQYELGDMR